MMEQDESRLESIFDNFIKNPPFPCERCGMCCTIPTELDISKKEIRAIAKYKGITVSNFRRKYKLRKMSAGMWLMPTAPCPFLEGENGCSIYNVRPVTCRHYPFGHLRQAFLNKTRFTAFCPIVFKALNNSAVSSMKEKKKIE